MKFLRYAKFVMLLSLLLVGAQSARAFSLQGPLPSWAGSELYDYTHYKQGVMNIGEAYRWNFPVINYTYDPTFLTYFGSNGVVAVEKAIKILNDLPAASEIDLSKYPTFTTRINYRASALMLTDMKSHALYALLQEIGLTSPENYVWTLRSLTHDPDGVPFFNVMKRNIDPYTPQYSLYVNGNLFTYYIEYSANPEWAEAIEVLVDPLGRYYSAVASGATLMGQYYTGLTRDDVAAIKYIYSKSRPATENLDSNSVAAVTGISYGAGGSSSGWYSAQVGTNNTDIGSVGSGALIGTGSGWYSLNITNNSTSTNTTDVTTTTTNTYVDLAVRGGVEKLTFHRMGLDSVFGSFIPTTNLFTDTYYTNGVKVRQVLQRIVASPDLLFGAADLGMDGGAPDRPVSFEYDDAFEINNGPNNNGPNRSGDGPGVIIPYKRLWFSKLGPWYFNGLAFPTEVTATHGQVYMWGSFDGSTNEPIAFPDGTSIKAVEAQLFGN